jgi:hypothetical protein
MVVEQSPHHPKVRGSSPAAAAGTDGDAMTKESFETSSIIRTS